MLMRAVVQVDLCRGPERQLQTWKTSVFPVFLGYRKLAVAGMFDEFDLDSSYSEREPETLETGSGASWAKLAAAISCVAGRAAFQVMPASVETALSWAGPP